AACGGDAEDSPATPDTGVDTDTGEDTGGDAGTDVVEDTTPDAEICTDGIDNDGDGNADCADDDCASAAACIEAGNCDDGTDNDGDGATDCDDDECALDDACLECPAGTESVNGNCVANDQTIEAYVPSGFVSFVNTIALPETEGEDDWCCFDLNGDDEIDNSLGGLISALGPLLGDLDVPELINGALADDDIAIIMEWTRWPAEADFSLWLATNDLDGDEDGLPDQSFEDRSAGNGVFRLQNESFTNTGSFIQFNTTSYTGTSLEAGPSQFNLSIPIPGIFDEPLQLTILDARITAEMTEDGGSIASTPEDLNNGDEDITYGGAELGGVVLLDEIFGIIDDLARDCACAGINPDEAVLEFGDNGDTYAAACVQTPGDAEACGEDDGIICAQLGLVCQFASTIPTLAADIDVDGNGVEDAASVGVRLGWVGASIDEQAFDTE
ncbi:MAG: hypothetical protein ACI82G_002212, partial [Bradymonadia bacterium]